MTTDTENVLIIDGEFDCIDRNLTINEKLETFCPLCDAPQEAYVEAIEYERLSGQPRVVHIRVTHQTCDCPKAIVKSHPYTQEGVAPW